jgi:phage terminase small subunit
MENSKKETSKKTDSNQAKRNSKNKSTSTGLTQAQEKYAQGLFMGLSQREAYEAAYKTDGWKTSLIDSKASELAKNGKIKARLNELQDKQKVRIENRIFVNKEMILKELKKIGFCNIKDFAEIAEGKICVGINKDTWKPIFVDDMVVNFKSTQKMPKTKLAAVSGIKQGKNGIEIKFFDKIKALELLGKELGMFVERNEVEIKDLPKIEIKRGGSGE